MKRVLITGKNSYIGTNVERWLMKDPDNFYVETLDMRNPKWQEFDFSQFDVVFHVAGIAHIKETKKNKELYFIINQDMAIQTAEKSKTSGVSQFIFMSSMAVYGLKKGIINRNSILDPKSYYSISKLNAELEIKKIENEKFKVVILRPPMIYGPRSLGNYRLLSKFVKKIRFFPKINNKKSLLFIDHFSEFLKIIISMSYRGLFHPQNLSLSSSSDIVQEISLMYNKKIIISKFFNFIYIFSFIEKISKVFGPLYYDGSLYSELELIIIKKSSIYTFRETIRMTENSL